MKQFARSFPQHAKEMSRGGIQADGLRRHK
jgi:hypothetical protein